MNRPSLELPGVHGGTATKCMPVAHIKARTNRGRVDQVECVGHQVWRGVPHVLEEHRRSTAQDRRPELGVRLDPRGLVSLIDDLRQHVRVHDEAVQPELVSHPQADFQSLSRRAPYLEVVAVDVQVLEGPVQ